MKLIACSDAHLDHISMGVRRFDDVREAMLETVAAAEQMKADAYFFLGDLCDPDKNLSVFAAVEFAIYVALRLRRAKIPSYWLAGNHDVIETSEGKTTLSPLSSLEALEGAPIRVLEVPGTIVEPNWPTIVALPFTSSLQPYDPEKMFELPEARGKRDCITLGHLNVPGIIPGEETLEMPRGREVIFPTETAKKHSALMLHGHFHQQQVTPDGIHIPGSLARLTATEGKYKPSFLVIETEL